MKKRVRNLLAASVVVPALLGLGTWSIREAYAACSMHFNNAIDQWQSNSIGSFGVSQTPLEQERGLETFN